MGLGDLFSAAETLSRAVSPRRGERLAILTNGGGFGVLATDAWLDAGGAMAVLSDATIATLDKVLPPTWSRANPADIVGDAGAQRYDDALSALQADPGIDTILALNCPTGVSSPVEAADGLLAAWAKRPKYATPNLLACWLTAHHGETIRARFSEAGMPAVVITAGFGEGTEETGMHLRQAMLEAARPMTLRIIGPNCLGLVAPGVGVNASFSASPARDGAIACFTQ